MVAQELEASRMAAAAQTQQKKLEAEAKKWKQSRTNILLLFYGQY